MKDRTLPRFNVGIRRPELLPCPNSSLRDCRHGQFAAMWDAADALWQSIFDKDRRRFPVARIHARRISKTYVERLEDRLDQWLFGSMVGTSLPPASYLPTSKESLLLLAAIWLHPIGFSWGLFDEELNDLKHPLIPDDEEKTQRQLEAIADKAMLRTERFLKERWLSTDPFPEWNDADRTMLATLCASLQPNFPLSGLEYSGEPLGGHDRPHDEVNLRKLAALLRVASVSLMGRAPCPLIVRSNLRLPDIQAPESAFESVTDLVTDVLIDHDQEALRIQSHCPESIDLETSPVNGFPIPITLDARPMLEHLRSVVDATVQEAAEVLKGCANTRIRTAKLDTPVPTEGAIKLDEFAHRIWPLQLSAMTGASEEASCFGLVVKRMLEHDSHGPSTSQYSTFYRVWNKCKTIRRLQPYNVLGTRLARDLLKAIQTWPRRDRPSPQLLNEAIQLIERFLKERHPASQHLGEFAARLLDDTDQFLVYGFSRNVLKVLEHLDLSQKKLWAVSCAPEFRRPSSRWSFVVNDETGLSGENARLHEWCKQQGAELEVIDVLGLPAKIASTKAQGKDVTFLAGARSVIWNDELSPPRRPAVCFATIGNKTVANAARRENAKVVVVAERGKIAVPHESTALNRLHDRQKRNPELPSYCQVDQLVQFTDFDDLLIPTAPA